MDFNFKFDAQTVWQFLAGVGGSVAGLRAIPGKGKMERAITLCTGIAFAVFLGPGIAEALNLETEKLHAAVIFATGASGLVVFGAVMDGVKATPFGTLLVDFVRAWFPKTGTKGD